MQRLLTPRETDQLLRYPNGRSVKLAKAGKLPAIILPDGEFRFVHDDIQALLQLSEINVKNRESVAVMTP